jgi:hypothetical protein
MAQSLLSDAVKWVETANAHDHEFVTLRIDKAMALVEAVQVKKINDSVKKSDKDRKSI